LISFSRRLVSDHGSAVFGIASVRALGIALRMIRKHYPHIEWIVSFADACQCGDGTIYRAAGFALTLIKTNKDVMRFADGSVGHKMSQVTGGNRLQHFAATGGKWSGIGTPLEGHTLRYIYFLNPAARARLNAEVLPYSAIEARGASMYRGVRGKQAMAGSAKLRSAVLYRGAHAIWLVISALSGA
jgi:hypothetical protein